MKKIAAVLLLCMSAFAWAQSRDDVRIFIPMPLGGTTEEEQFFKDRFIMETTAAGYGIVEDQKDADYIIRLSIKPNLVIYDDGSEGPAPADEAQKVLELSLRHNDDRTEMVRFTFPYTEKEEVDDFSLVLLYQAVANVPMTKLRTVPDTDHWRNKWLYLTGNFNFFLSVYQADIDGFPDNAVWDNNLPGGGSGWEHLNAATAQSLSFLPGGVLGLELQFLDYMSFEADFKLIFGDTEDQSFIPTMGFFVKFPLKPSKYYMLEPYLGIDLPMATASHLKKFPFIGIGGGFQLGMKGGEMGAFVVDINASFNIGDVRSETDFRKADWSRYVVGVGIGYKVGFVNRHPDE
jgi:hypothetical protein